MDQFNLLLDGNAPLNELYDRYRAKGEEKEVRINPKREEPASDSSRPLKFFGIGLAAFTGLVLLVVKLLRFRQPHQKAIKAATS